MGSMPTEEVFRRLERMIARAEKQGKTKKRLALIIAMDGLMASNRQMKYGNCNTCGNARECGMAPVWGGGVRWNCPHYDGPDEIEPWRGEQ